VTTRPGVVFVVVILYVARYVVVVTTRRGLAVVVVVRGMCDHAEQVKEVVQCFGDLKGFHLLVDPQEVRNQPMYGVLIGAQSAHVWRAHYDWMFRSRRWARTAVLLSSSMPSLNRQSRRTHIDAAHAILTP